MGLLTTMKVLEVITSVCPINRILKVHKDRPPAVLRCMGQFIELAHKKTEKYLVLSVKVVEIMC